MKDADAELWDRPDVRAALHTGDFGALLRAVRKWTGRSQSSVAAHCDLSQPDVSAIESGRRQVTSASVQRRILDGLAVPSALRPGAFRPAEQPKPGDYTRRSVLGTGAVLAAGLLADAPHAEHLDAGRRVGQELIEGLRARTARFRRLDDHLGGADTYQLYAREVEATASLVRCGSYSDATGRALLGVLSEQTQQAGWAAFDAGDHDRAAELYESSLEAARRAGESALAGNALALLAYQQNETGRKSVDTAAAAYREAGVSAAPGARALLAQRLAWAHAAAGQANATQHALNVAEQHLRQDGPPSPDWAAWADEREQRIITGRCWSELGRPLRAVPILESVLAEYEDSHARDKALYLTWLARAYADAGEVEAAAVTTARALDLSTSVASVRPARRTAAVLQRLEQHRALPVVRDLLERAAA